MSKVFASLFALLLFAATVGAQHLLTKPQPCPCGPGCACPGGVCPAGCPQCVKPAQQPGLVTARPYLAAQTQLYVLPTVPPCPNCLPYYYAAPQPVIVQPEFSLRFGFGKRHH